ncbi:DUF3820 family protein [Thermoanaerobacterium thermosaccharolyticum]|uniref:putative quorum-sensing-regulated virulence factor n=1 Tax=Thermoanaerobacterium thermosaccharolyticum TaxID=1517 RepID=UPI003DA9DC13
MEEIQEYKTNDDLIETGTSPQEMSMRLAAMKQKLNLVQQFFKEVMINGQDYGVIPGTDKPTLLKSGAEKLCELYGYAPIIKNIDETTDQESGYYRARVTVALIHKKTGEVIAEGVGEANTMESRYYWRWIPEWKLPAGIDKSVPYSEERTNKNGEKYRVYRLQNEDLWSLWNTVLKMAKKRALIDATLSATRSSGIFTQDIEDLQGWATSNVTAQKQKTNNNNINVPPEEIILGFGKYKGKKLGELPDDYLDWLTRNANDENMRKAAMEVLNSKGQKEDEDDKMDIPPDIFFEDAVISDNDKDFPWEQK